MIDYLLLNAKLREIRLKNGLTLDQQAKEMGITPHTLGRYLDGKIPEQRLKGVCDYAQIKVEKVLRDE